MVDDKLYRLTIPGAVFVFMFVGWLAADSSMTINELLPKPEMDSNTKLATAIFSGGLMVVVVGYICGEIGLAMKVPDSNMHFARGKSKGDGRHNSCCLNAAVSQRWKATVSLLFVACLLILGFVQILFPYDTEIFRWFSQFTSDFSIKADSSFFSPYLDCIASVLSLICSGFATYAYLQILKWFVSITAQRDDVAFHNLWRLIHAPMKPTDSVKVDVSYNLEALTVFTHGRVASMEKLYLYISRAWGRIVIGSSSIIATVLAFQAYWNMRVQMSPPKDSAVGPLVIFFLVNLLFVTVIGRSIVVQQEHRRKLYILLLRDPRTGIVSKSK